MWTLVWFVIVLGGCAVGLVLRPDPDAPATVASGQGWKVQVHNEDGDKFVELVIGGKVRTAQCEFLVNGAFRETSYDVAGGPVVILGRVPDGVERVRLRLADGSRPVVEVDEKKDVRYFVYEADGPDKGPTELLDAQGDVVDPSS
jgi:hypothetical protein